MHAPREPSSLSAPRAETRGGLAESPWFWAALFAVTALAALAAIGPKHALRQERLIRMNAARERVRFGQVAPAEGASAEGAPVAPLAGGGESLVPLASFLVIILLGILVAWRMRPRGAGVAPTTEPREGSRS